jgi:hypothetical protein
MSWIRDIMSWIILRGPLICDVSSLIPGVYEGRENDIGIQLLSAATLPTLPTCVDDVPMGKHG